MRYKQQSSSPGERGARAHDALASVSSVSFGASDINEERKREEGEEKTKINAQVNSYQVKMASVEESLVAAESMNYDCVCHTKGL